jgi:hypothetical protein
MKVFPAYMMPFFRMSRHPEASWHLLTANFAPHVPYMIGTTHVWAPHGPWTVCQATRPGLEIKKGAEKAHRNTPETMKTSLKSSAFGNHPNLRAQGVLKVNHGN